MPSSNLSQQVCKLTLQGKPFLQQNSGKQDTMSEIRYRSTTTIANPLLLPHASTARRER